VALLAAVPAAGSSSAAAAYRIGPKDLLEIKVLEVPELNVERRVGVDGTIDLPGLGEIAVQGLTEGDVGERVRQLLEPKYLQRATVSVAVREFRSRPIIVLGAVKTPGNLDFSGRWTLLEALAAAGGLADQHGDVIYVQRRADNGLSDQIGIAVDDLIVKGDPQANIPIFANDIINVPPVSTVTVFFLGAISTRGAVQFRSNERISVLTGIARAGGLSDRASNEVLVKRRLPDGRQTELRANFKRILAGKDADLELRDGDVVVVKESFL